MGEPAGNSYGVVKEMGIIDNWDDLFLLQTCFCDTGGNIPGNMGDRSRLLSGAFDTDQPGVPAEDGMRHQFTYDCTGRRARRNDQH